MMWKTMRALLLAMTTVVAGASLSLAGCDNDAIDVESANGEGDAGLFKASGCEGRCSRSCRCEVGEGDCDVDADCKSGLVCPEDRKGKEVCERAPSRSCSGRCSPSCPCNEGQGDCDRDSDCAGDLVCPPDGKGKEVCEQPSRDCEGRCSPSCPCQLGQGDCDKNSDCAGSLVCPPDRQGRENCEQPGTGSGGDAGGGNGGGNGDGNQSGELHIVVFSVGSADAALIKFPTGATMMVDSGTASRFADRVLPFLKRHRIRHLDYYAETHPHKDHVGGRARLESDGFIDGRTEVWDWETHDYEDSFSLEGTDWFIYNVRDKSFHGSDANENSLSFRMEYNGFVYSSTGDEGVRSQKRFMRDHPSLVRAHVRNTAHHMWGPTHQPFLVATDPYLMIISSIRSVREEPSYRRDFLGAVQELERKNGKLRDHVLTADVGHVLIRATGRDDWSYDFCKNMGACVVEGLK